MYPGKFAEIRILASGLQASCLQAQCLLPAQVYVRLELGTRFGMPKITEKATVRLQPEPGVRHAIDAAPPSPCCSTSAILQGCAGLSAGDEQKKAFEPGG
jgi:hypothetical protein